MCYLGWGLFVAFFAWCIYSNQMMHRTRLGLNYYIIYLLLDDEMRSRYKQDFTKWIVKLMRRMGILVTRWLWGHPQHSPPSSRGEAHGKGASLFGALGMMWKVKQGEPLSDPLP